MNIKAQFSDLAHQYTGIGWIAVDEDTYCGAPDSDSLIGRGVTEDEAVEDLKDQMEGLL